MGEIILAIIVAVVLYYFANDVVNKTIRIALYVLSTILLVIALSPIVIILLLKVISILL